MPLILEPTCEAMTRAAAALRAERVVAFPTETVYGLGADVFSEQAIARIYALKGRPSDNPLIVHVRDAVQAREEIVVGWDARCDQLVEQFWPGPLTLILVRRDSVPSAAAGGLGTIAVRTPAHSVARRLLSAFGGPIAAPSANRSGHVSPTSAAHVADDFSDADDLCILDGGPCEIGIESTVLDMTSDPPRVLRPGSVSFDALRSVLGEVRIFHTTVQDRSPGTAQRHYAPATPAVMLSAESIMNTLKQDAATFAVLWLSDPPDDLPAHTAIRMPRAAEPYAAALYDALRRADASSVDRILIEYPPDHPVHPGDPGDPAPPGHHDLWHSIRDRLHRATA